MMQSSKNFLTDILLRSEIKNELAMVFFPLNSYNISVMSRVPEAARIEVITLKAAGLNFAQISERLGVSYKTVRAIHKKFTLHGTVQDMPRSGRPPTFDDRAKRRLKRIFESKQAETIEQGMAMAHEAGLPAVSRSTMHNLMHEMNLHVVRTTKP
jgi:transposase